jgi:hypothetical protein
MEFVNQQYGIVGQYRSNSNNGTGRMTTINMRGVTDNKHYITYVVDSYKNYKHWKNIVLHPDVGYVVRFPNGRLSKPGQIDADSIPVIQTTGTTTEINQVIDELNYVAPKRYKPTKAEVLAQLARTQAMIEDLFE